MLAPALATRLRLAPAQLRRTIDPQTLPFTSTAEVPPLVGTIGQPRAIRAIQFGLETATFGYNLYVAGQIGTGRNSTVRAFLAQIAPTKPVPNDWCYVFNFQDPYRPMAIGLPAGQGSQFARDMEDLIAGCQREIPRALESEDYARRRNAILSEIAQRREQVIREFQREAARQGFAVEITPAGIITIPLVQGRPLSPEAYARLPEEVRREIEERSAQLRQQALQVLRQLHQLEKEAAERVQALDREVALFAVGPLFAELREKYASFPRVLAYLDAVEADIPQHLAAFAARGEMEDEERDAHLLRYRVNVIVDHRNTVGAPVIIEHNPTYYNLFGRIEYRVRMGVLATDFTMIRGGALHRANGGYIVLQALDVLLQPFVWETLKRSLRSQELAIENIAEQYSPLPTAALRPEPIPLDVKVILVGPPLLYYLLYFFDPEFPKLFKVRADFDVEMPLTPETLQAYAAFISARCRDLDLPHFDRSGVARIVEHSLRLTENQRKLSTRFLEIESLISEAAHWARQNQHPLVTAADVDRAIAEREYRANLLEERFHEWIAEGTIAIETTGQQIGQINGLSIIPLGDYEFARPNRITCRVGLGTQGIINIEREIKLSGRIHNKGFLILVGFLQGRYAADVPLAITAQIGFEQTYDEIEGDSASSAELYALLSALADLPLRQGLAVTGAVNQFGEVLAVGGVTRKIEGFFDVCKARGLTGDQGVIIPAANVPHLMLKNEVVEAVRAGQFHIYAVRHIDEGIELLTGVPAGQRQPDGTYPPGSVNDRVIRRLRQFAQTLREFQRGGRTESPAPTESGHETEQE